MIQKSKIKMEKHNIILEYIIFEKNHWLKTEPFFLLNVSKCHSSNIKSNDKKKVKVHFGQWIIDSGLLTQLCFEGFLYVNKVLKLRIVTTPLKNT